MPAFNAAAASAVPKLPVLTLRMLLTGSMGTVVPPLVIRIRILEASPHYDNKPLHDLYYHIRSPACRSCQHKYYRIARPHLLILAHSNSGRKATSKNGLKNACHR